MAKKKNEKKKSFSHIILMGVALLAVAIYLINKNSLQDIRGRAQDDNTKFCQDHCSPDGKSCDLTSPSKDDCCEELRKTGNPLACPWPERGYCSIDQCNSIPAGVSRQRCGGPRHSWCGECQTHTCPGYDILPTQSPVQPTAIIEVPSEGPPPTLLPTTIPAPTNQFIPTQGVQPENPRPQITYVPIDYPTYSPPLSPTIIPTSKPSSVSLPNILPSRGKIEITINDWKSSFMKFINQILP